MCRYEVTVKAFNALGDVVSEPVQVHVVDPINDLRIELITQDVVVNKPIEFLAHNYAGSDVKYYWSMGDGQLINTTVYKIKHTYNRYVHTDLSRLCRFYGANPPLLV